MISSSKFKSVDFYRKIPRDLTEASLSGAGLSIIAALSMLFLFGMELNNYLTVTTSTAVIVDKSTDGDFLRIDFNMSFPSLSCEFASIDVSDVLGTLGKNGRSIPALYLTVFNSVITIFLCYVTIAMMPSLICIIFPFQKPSWEKAAKTMREV